MEIIHYPAFVRALKRLHKNAKADLDKAILTIQGNLAVGGLKTGNLSGIRVYKFRMVNQLTLLAYDYDGISDKLTLLAFGPHENFYRDLNKG
jgi:hypothetical protein